MIENIERHLEMSMAHIRTQKARIQVLNLSLFLEKLENSRMKLTATDPGFKNNLI